MKKYFAKFFNKPVSRVIFGSLLLALLFMLVSNFFPIPLWLRFTIAALIASPFTIGIPVAETYFRAREGSLGWIIGELLKDWSKIVLFAIALGICAYFSNLSVPLSILVGVGVGIGAPVHGAMSGSFFMRMIKRGLM